MTIDHFRDAPERVAEAAGSPILNTAKRILEADAPHRKPVTITTETTAQIQLGRIMGFQEAIDLLTLMQTLKPRPAEETPVTYTQTPEKEDENA